MLTAEDDFRKLRNPIPDVGLVNLGNSRCDGLEVGAELTALFPWIEVAFWFDESRNGPEAMAARFAGARRLAPLDVLLRWLKGNFVHLARMARARRELIGAETCLSPLPAIQSDDFSVPLPEAERRFRETYLRRMLAGSASHIAAAKRAGIPYTTLCSMLKKLNLP